MFTDFDGIEQKDLEYTPIHPGYHSKTWANVDKRKLGIFGLGALFVVLAIMMLFGGSAKPIVPNRTQNQGIAPGFGTIETRRQLVQRFAADYFDLNYDDISENTQFMPLDGNTEETDEFFEDLRDFLNIEVDNSDRIVSFGDLFRNIR